MVSGCTMLLSHASNSNTMIKELHFKCNTLWIPTQPCRNGKSFFAGAPTLTGNEFGVPLPEEYPQRDGAHEKVVDVAIDGHFLFDGREGVGNAESIIVLKFTRVSVVTKLVFTYW